MEHDTYCAPLERGVWVYRYSIDIALRWSAEIHMSPRPPINRDASTYDGGHTPHQGQYALVFS